MTSWSGFIVIFLCLRFSSGFLIKSSNGSISPIDVRVIRGAVGVNYTTFSVNSTQEYLFEYPELQNNSSKPARVTVECVEATRQYPVLVVLRQAKGVLSWQLPLMVPTKNDRVQYPRTSRTLCPNKNYGKHSLHGQGKQVSGGDQDVFITISTSSASSLKFSLLVELEDDFIVSVSENRTMTVNPSEPRFYEFAWSKADSVVLRVDSEGTSSNVCMAVSIQNVTCPVFDLERTVQFEGLRQTMDSRGGITLTKSYYPNGFYIVLVVKGDDYDCTGTTSNNDDRNKEITFSFKPSISFDEYIKATVSAVFLFLSFYVFAIIVSVAYFIRNRNNPDFMTESGVESASQVDASFASTSRHNSQVNTIFGSSSRFGSNCNIPDSDDSSLDETDIDTLADADYDKDVIRTKKMLYVCDLARKNPKILRKKSLMYFWNLLTVATFYVLPVVQLVISSQMVLHQTGNQDLCYYNFLCAHPLGFLSDFNHVFSNVGYVVLGLLFVILVHRRDRMHCNAVAKQNDLDKLYGIPQHYGLLYAMGAALMMEGVLSGCYHVCPNHSNFQFDTSFMYVISMLCMLKIYHTRHPDINASAYSTFGVLALVILVGMAGILSGTTYFWAGFSVLHLLVCLWLSGKIYYMGRLRLRFGMFRQAWNLCRREMIPNPCVFFKPRYPSRMVLLILGNMCNWALAALVWIYPVKSSFGSYLLAIFMSNLMLYTIFYIVMKYLSGERLRLQPAAYFLLATAGWASSLYFFFNKSISWAVTPAQSREFNRPCVIMDFYDNHDIWHFLSAMSMFFSFLALLTLDDDLIHVPRSRIRVF